MIPAAEPPLLDPAFVRELEALRRKLAGKTPSGGSGDHAAKRRGGAAEFQEHRAYAPGDDLRRVDWMAFARTGEPVVKLFRTEDDVIIRLVVDTSQSMAFGAPSKIDVARRFAAAVGYMALASAERAQIARATAGLPRLSKPLRGKSSLAPLLQDLSDIEASGETRLERTIDGVTRQAQRPGMLVVISDFFDPGPVTHALGRAHAMGHDIALVQVLTAEELNPTLAGDVVLVDAETNAEIELTADPAALRAYLAKLAVLVEDLRAFARKAGGTYVRIRTDEPWHPAVRRFVGRAVDDP
jgi:uncharacterized protein (DUF58 family)